MTVKILRPSTIKNEDGVSVPLIVRDPKTNEKLPPHGEHKEISAYWERQLATNAVFEVTQEEWEADLTGKRPPVKADKKLVEKRPARAQSSQDE